MFDVKKHLIKVQGGRQYLPVAARLIWFRTEHPDWGIETKVVAIDVEREYAIFESTVYNADGKLMAKGTKMENVRGFGDWLEKAETGAIGRALAVCGYGTQFAPDLDESHNNDVADDSYMPRSYDDKRGHYNNGPRSDGHASNAHYQSNGRNSSSNDKPSSPIEGLSLVSHGEETSLEGAALAVKAEAGSGDHCESCNTALKPSQLSLSLRKFGAALCPECQRSRKSG